MDGIALCRQIRQRLPDVDILFLTAYSEKEYLKSAIVLRAVNFLEKPVNRRELHDLIVELVDKINKKKQVSHPVNISNEDVVLDLIDTQGHYIQNKIVLKNGQSITCLYIKIGTDHSDTSGFRLDVKTDLLNDVQKVLGQNMDAAVAMKKVDGLVALLIAEPAPNKKYFESKISKLNEILSQYYGAKTHVFIGISEPVTDEKEVLHAYQEAVINAQQYFL